MCTFKKLKGCFSLFHKYDIIWQIFACQSKQFLFKKQSKRSKRDEAMMPTVLRGALKN